LQNNEKEYISKLYSFSDILETLFPSFGKRKEKKVSVNIKLPTANQFAVHLHVLDGMIQHSLSIK